MSKDLITLLLIAPLIGFLINGLFGKWLKNVSGWIASLAVLISFIISAFFVFPAVRGGDELKATLYEWIPVESLNIGFHVDALTTVMLLVITGVGFLIHIYSIGYMSHDSGRARYFAYLNLFVFAMLILVLGNNYLMMFIGWEGVGLCSYLLIGYWFEKNLPPMLGRRLSSSTESAILDFCLGCSHCLQRLAH